MPFFPNALGYSVAVFSGPHLVELLYGGSETHDPSVAPLIKTQEHAPLHGWAALHRPLHTPIRAGLLLSCRAETVPAHRTAVTIAASNVGVIFLLMINLLTARSNLLGHCRSA